MVSKACKESRKGGRRLFISTHLYCWFQHQIRKIPEVFSLSSTQFTFLSDVSVQFRDCIDLSAGPKPNGKMVPADLMLDYVHLSSNFKLTL